MNMAHLPPLRRPFRKFDSQSGPRLRLTGLLATSWAITFCSLLISCDSKTEPASSPEASGTNVSTTASSVRPEFTKLVGKWERPDGGYVLEIKSVDSSGKVEAGYYNPAPINVSRAAALRESGTTKVFVELKDANYPGCTYSLTYDPQSDQLFGQYFQASMQQTFDVVFARLK